MIAMPKQTKFAGCIVELSGIYGLIFVCLFKRLKRLMDLDDVLANSLRVEGYDDGCIWENAKNKKFPKGKTDRSACTTVKIVENGITEWHMIRMVCSALLVEFTWNW